MEPILQGDTVVFEQIGRVFPVSFFGRRLTPKTEQRWDTMCREMLSLVVGYESSFGLWATHNILNGP